MQVPEVTHLVQTKECNGGIRLLRHQSFYSRGCLFVAAAMSTCVVLKFYRRRHAVFSGHRVVRQNRLCGTPCMKRPYPSGSLLVTLRLETGGENIPTRPKPPLDNYCNAMFQRKIPPVDAMNSKNLRSLPNSWVISRGPESF